MNQEKIGKFIAKKRKEQKMTQQELADKLKVTDKAISKWENGRCLMDISLLKPLSETLNISILELLTAEEIKKEAIDQKSTEAIENTLIYANKKIKKDKIKWILLTGVTLTTFIITLFGIYKLVLINKYKINIQRDYKEIVNGLKKEDTIKIYKRTIAENLYLVDDDIKIRNDFLNYTKTDKKNEYDSVKYVMYDKDNNIKNMFTIGSMPQYIDVFVSDDIILFSNMEKGDFLSADRKYFLLKNDINDDLDFLEYIKNNYVIKNNIFMSKRTIKENYAFNTFVNIVMPKISSITIISGDYRGYIFDIKDKYKEVYVLKNNKSYIFSFIGDDISNNEYIKDIISTLEIK